MGNNHFIKIENGYYFDERYGIFCQKYETVKFTKDFTYSYDNHIHRLAKLSQCSLLLINYLTDHSMGNNGTVFNQKSERLQFIKFCSKNCSKMYKDNTVKKAFSDLAKNYLLISYKERSVYTVNPRYYYKGTEEGRRKLLNEMCDYAFFQQGIKGIEMRKALGFNKPEKVGKK